MSAVLPVPTTKDNLSVQGVVESAQSHAPGPPMPTVKERVAKLRRSGEARAANSPGDGMGSW